MPQLVEDLLRADDVQQGDEPVADGPAGRETRAPPGERREVDVAAVQPDEERDRRRDVQEQLDGRQVLSPGGRSSAIPTARCCRGLGPAPSAAQPRARTDNRSTATVAPKEDEHPAAPRLRRGVLAVSGGAGGRADRRQDEAPLLGGRVSLVVSLEGAERVRGVEAGEGPDAGGIPPRAAARALLLRLVRPGAAHRPVPRQRVMGAGRAVLRARDGAQHRTARGLLLQVHDALIGRKRVSLNRRGRGRCGRQPAAGGSAGAAGAASTAGASAGAGVATLSPSPRSVKYISVSAMAKKGPTTALAIAPPIQ